MTSIRSTLGAAILAVFGLIGGFSTDAFAQTQGIYSGADATRYVAERYDIPVIEGHLVWPNSGFGDISGNSQIGGLRTGEIRARWSRFWNEQNLISGGITFDRAQHFAKIGLSLEEKIALFVAAGRDRSHAKIDAEFFSVSRNELDEFEQQDFLAAVIVKIESPTRTSC